MRSPLTASRQRVLLGRTGHLTAETTFEQWWEEVLKVLKARGFPAPRDIAELAWEAGKQVGLDINY